MGRLRVAIVGAGLMGGWHARYAAREGGEVAAVIDNRIDAARALAAGFPGAGAFETLERGLASRPLEVVHVCTGLQSHAALAEAALAAGKHVLVEKPLCGSAAETSRLVALARDKRLVLSPVHQFPFQAGFRRLASSRAALGEPVRAAFATSTAGADGRSGAERRAVLLEILPHPLSLFRALFGGVEPASWSVLALTDDELEMASRRSGTRLSILISLRARPTRNELVVAGTRATARLDLFHGFLVLEPGAVSRRAKLLAPFSHGSRLLFAAGTNLVRRTLEREPAYPGLRELIRRFYEAVRQGAAPPVGFEESVEVAAVIERVRAAT